MSDREDPRANADEHANSIERLLKAAGPRRAPPEHSAARIRAAVHGEWQAMNRRRRKRRITVAAAVAALLITVVGLSLWLENRSSTVFAPRIVAHARLTEGPVVIRSGDDSAPLSLVTAQPLYAGTTIETSGGSAALTLAGGAELRLDSQSAVRLVGQDEFFINTGRVYVDAANDARSLTARTGFGAVRDIGTQFELVVDVEQLVVRVREGAVSITTDSENIEIRRGQGVRVRADGRARAFVASPSDPSWRWVRGLSRKLGAQPTVAELVSWFAREEGFVLRYDDESTQLAAQRVRVAGDLGQLEPSDLLAVALETTSFRAQVEDDELLIQRVPDER